MATPQTAQNSNSSNPLNLLKKAVAPLESVRRGQIVEIVKKSPKIWRIRMRTKRELEITIIKIRSVLQNNYYTNQPFHNGYTQGVAHGLEFAIGKLNSILDLVKVHAENPTK